MFCSFTGCERRLQDPRPHGCCSRAPTRHSVCSMGDLSRASLEWAQSKCFPPHLQERWLDTGSRRPRQDPAGSSEVQAPVSKHTVCAGLPSD